MAEKFLNFHTVKGRPSFTSSLQHFIWTVMSQEKRFSKFSTSSSFTSLWDVLKYKEKLIEISSWNGCSIQWKFREINFKNGICFVVIWRKILNMRWLCSLVWRNFWNYLLTCFSGYQRNFLACKTKISSHLYGASSSGSSKEISS